MEVASTSSFQTGNCQDPVRKAVIDYIFGVLPTKKPKIVVSCEVCNLNFASHATLETHLKGSKHAKRIGAKTIMETISSHGEIIRPVEGKNIFKCVTCEKTLNSSQQLLTHLSGSKHKQNVARNLDYCKKNSYNIDFSNEEECDSGVVNVIQMKNCATRFSCGKCSVTLNSAIQLQQHLKSRKHFIRTTLNGNKTGGFEYFTQ